MDLYAASLWLLGGPVMNTATIFGTPEIMLADILRIFAIVCTLAVLAVTPFIFSRNKLMGVHQKFRYIGASGITFGLTLAYIDTLGTVPVSWWRTSIIITSIGTYTVGCLLQVRAEPPLELRRVIVDRLSNIPAALVLANSNGQIITAAGQTKTVLNRETDQMVGTPLAALMPAKYVQAHLDGIERVSRTGEAPIAGKRLPLEAIYPDGTPVPIYLTVIPLHNYDAVTPGLFLGILEKRTVTSE